MNHYRITFITPLFSKGSYEDKPEIRPSSIRGQLHWWFRALGGNATDENRIFGSIKPVQASKIVVRVSNIQGKTAQLNTLPHKSGNQASPKWAFDSGTSFDLHILERLGGLSEPDRVAFFRTLETWLLLGTLGLRSTRACGSFTCLPMTDSPITMPESLEAWQSRCAKLLDKAPLKLHIIPKPFDTAKEARHIVSDTIGGQTDQQIEDCLAAIRYPLGKIRPAPRKTSPLRFRIITIGSKFHIVALWDDRSSVTDNLPEDLPAVIKLLADKKKIIGQLLHGFQ